MIQKPQLTEQVSWESEGPGSFIHLLKGHSLVLKEMSLKGKEKNCYVILIAGVVGFDFCTTLFLLLFGL